jgi:hypothetical protein
MQPKAKAIHGLKGRVYKNQIVLHVNLGYSFLFLIKKTYSQF